MAFPAFDKGFFQVTALSFSPSVVAVGETATMSITIKNVSGKSVTQCYVDEIGKYPSAEHQGGGDFPGQFIYGGGGSSGWDMKRISWGNNVSQTFTATISFAEGYYHLDSTSYVLDPARSYIHIGIVTNATFSDGGNYDGLYIRPDGACLSILSARDNPKLTLEIERAPNDEAIAVKTTAKLTSDAAASAVLSHGYSFRLYATNAHNPALPTDTAFSFNATVADVIAGITDSASAIADTFSNGTDWYFLLTVSNGYEAASAYSSIPRAFANVHFAGMATGGVAFGKFSSSTQGHPKFECEYPAHLNGGIADFGGTIQSGCTESIRVGAGGYADVQIAFAKPYAAPPVVVVGFATGSTAGAFGRCCCSVLPDETLSGEGFTLRVFNGDSAARSPKVMWIAVGQV